MDDFTPSPPHHLREETPTAMQNMIPPSLPLPHPSQPKLLARNPRAAMTCRRGKKTLTNCLAKVITISVQKQGGSRLAGEGGGGGGGKEGTRNTHSTAVSEVTPQHSHFLRGIKTSMSGPREQYYLHGSAQQTTHTPGLFHLARAAGLPQGWWAGEGGRVYAWPNTAETGSNIF